MKTVYFNCFSGISGDMCLGAFVDAGLDINVLSSELKKIPIDNYKLKAKKTIKGGITATKVDVLISERGNNYKRGRKWKDVAEIIESSQISENIKNKGLQLFKKLFEIEGRIHGQPYEEVHLHELSATDCIVDIFGTLIALDFFKAEKIYTSEINVGSGTVNTSHGLLPIPAPATLELLKGYPLYSSGIPFELTTPTGALIISGLNAIYSPLPAIIIEAIGHGAGEKDITGIPNFLRVLIGREIVAPNHQGEEDVVTVIETNIDDMNPQFFEDIMERLFNRGALDVTLENIIMKKGRPALKLTVISKEEDVNPLCEIIFENTTTLGVRFYQAKRKVLPRDVKTITTSFGTLRIKISTLGDKIINATPEYDDLKILSRKSGIPLKKIFATILREIHQELHKVN